MQESIWHKLSELILEQKLDNSEDKRLKSFNSKKRKSLPHLYEKNKIRIEKRLTIISGTKPN